MSQESWSYDFTYLIFCSKTLILQNCYLLVTIDETWLKTWLLHQESVRTNQKFFIPRFVTFPLLPKVQQGLWKKDSKWERDKCRSCEGPEETPMDSAVTLYQSKNYNTKYLLSGQEVPDQRGGIECSTCREVILSAVLQCISTGEKFALVTKDLTFPGQVRNISNGGPAAALQHLTVSFWVKPRKPCVITIVYGENFWCDCRRSHLGQTVPNIPAHDTWINSRIIYPINGSDKFWIFFLTCPIRCTNRRGSYLSASTLSKWIISLLVHKCSFWLSCVTSSGWLPLRCRHFHGGLAILELLLHFLR